MQPILQTLQEEFRDALIQSEKSIHREYAFSDTKNMIKVAIGMRRSGKTYFLFQTIRELVSQGIPLDRILYINFEDDRILPLDQKAMGRMIDTWYTLNPDNHNHLCYLFFDELQNVDGWPVVLRRLLDTKKVQMYATGSSAKLLSKEIATSLRGRSLSLEIWPYSYPEYLQAHKLDFPTKPFGKKTEDIQKSYLTRFFQKGGFPGVQDMQEREMLETLQNYVETVVFRDIVERYKISNIALLKYFIHSLLKNIGSPFSINKFYNDVKSQGFTTSKDSLHAYLTYVEDAFLLFPVSVFSESLRRNQTTPKKIYAVDNGLILANTLNFSENFGKLLENQVYLDLRRQNKKIFYYTTQDGYEIDFITQDEKGKYEIIQVVWDISDTQALQREERALKHAEKELGFSGRILDAREYLQQFIKD